MRKLTIILIASIGYSISGNSQSIQADSTIEESKFPSKEHTITGSFEMNYLRHYLWRGLVFGNDDVAQPMLEINYKNFTLALSQNFNYKPKNVPKDFYTKNAFFDEQDVEIGYSKEWGKLSSEWKAMAYFYFYQPQSPHTAELYNYTSFNFYKGFSLFTENSVDFASYKGAVYSNNGLLFEQETKDNIKIEWTAYIGLANAKFNSSYLGLEEASLNLIGTHLDVTKSIKNFYLKLIVEKNTYSSSAIKEAAGINGTDNFGIATGINF